MIQLVLALNELFGTAGRQTLPMGAADLNSIYRPKIAGHSTFKRPSRTDIFSPQLNITFNSASSSQFSATFVYSHLSNMCRRRLVCNVYLKCGHAIALPEEIIQCTSTTCKFSSTHPATCLPPACTKTCWQYRQYPEQYSPNIADYCPMCKQGRC